MREVTCAAADDETTVTYTNVKHILTHFNTAITSDIFSGKLKINSNTSPPPLQKYPVCFGYTEHMAQWSWIIGH